jgi:hypothetical protein
MATHLAEATRVDPQMVHEPVAPKLTAFDIDANEDEERPTVARGIAAAVVLSAPFWAVFVLAVSLLL